MCCYTLLSISALKISLCYRLCSALVGIHFNLVPCLATVCCSSAYTPHQIALLDQHNMRSLLLLLLVLAVNCNAVRTRPMDVNSARIAPVASEISGCAGISNQRDCSERNCHWCSKDALSVCIHSTVLSRLVKGAWRVLTFVRSDSRHAGNHPR